MTTAAIEALSRRDVVTQFRRSKSGLAGLAILVGLLGMGIYSVQLFLSNPTGIGIAPFTG